jgi:hypothetical protein
MNPKYFSIKYLSDEKKNDIKIIIDRLLKNKYKIFKENSNLVTYLENINKLFGKDHDFDKIVAERERVISLYDSTRGTNTKELFNVSY